MKGLILEVSEVDDVQIVHIFDQDGNYLDQTTVPNLHAVDELVESLLLEVDWIAIQ